MSVGTFPTAVSYPLGAPTLTGTTLTVDLALIQPNRITQRIADITLQRFIVDRIFSSSGQTVAGGAVIYDQAVSNQLYTSRDVEHRMPGDEYPIVGGVRLAPLVAAVEDWGGKFFVTDEARRRNQVSYFDNQVTQLANTIVRKVNQRAIGTVEATLTAMSGAQTIIGHNWSAVIEQGSSATPFTGYPQADFAAAQLLADQKELGVRYDLWLINPQERAQLGIIYGQNLNLLLESQGIELFATNRVPAGVAYAVAKGQVGFLDYEQGLQTESWREQKTKRTWVQSSVLPVMGITNPFSIAKITGLHG